MLAALVPAGPHENAVSFFGATRAEARKPLSGDGLVPWPLLQVTHAVTIEAPPEKVWPWLTRIGQGRAGFYSDSWVWDRAVDWYYRLLSRESGQTPVGYTYKDDESVLAGALRQGDVIADGPPGTACYIVQEVEPNRTLVLFTTTHLPYMLPKRLRGQVRGMLSDAFVLVPVDGRTRLIRRMRLDCQPWAFRLLALPVVFLWGELITARQFLRGLKRRAEGRRT